LQVAEETTGCITTTTTVIRVGANAAITITRVVRARDPVAALEV